MDEEKRTNTMIDSSNWQLLGVVTAFACIPFVSLTFSNPFTPKLLLQILATSSQRACEQYYLPQAWSKRKRSRGAISSGGILAKTNVEIIVLLYPNQLLNLHQITRIKLNKITKKDYPKRSNLHLSILYFENLTNGNYNKTDQFDQFNWFFLFLPAPVDRIYQAA